VTISTGRASQTLTMKPEEVARVTLPVSDGVPYRRDEQPTSYVYSVSVETTSGFVPFSRGARRYRQPLPRRPGASDAAVHGRRDDDLVSAVVRNSQSKSEFLIAIPNS
jgi:hypothetical protein